MREVAVSAFWIWSLLMLFATGYAIYTQIDNLKGVMEEENEIEWKREYRERYERLDMPRTDEELDRAWENHTAMAGLGKGIAFLGGLWVAKESFEFMGWVWFWPTFFLLCVFLFSSVRPAPES